MLNLGDVKKLAQNAIDSKPEGREYVYVNPVSEGPKCLNVHVVNGVPEPGCIVGNILAQVVGIGNVPVSGPYDSTLIRAGIEVTLSAKRFLGDLQAKQDSGRTWGESYDYACGALSDDDAAES